MAVLNQKDFPSRSSRYSKPPKESIINSSKMDKRNPNSPVTENKIIKTIKTEYEKNQQLNLECLSNLFKIKGSPSNTEPLGQYGVTANASIGVTAGEFDMNLLNDMINKVSSIVSLSAFEEAVGGAMASIIAGAGMAARSAALALLKMLIPTSDVTIDKLILAKKICRTVIDSISMFAGMLTFSVSGQLGIGLPDFGGIIAGGKRLSQAIFGDDDSNVPRHLTETTDSAKDLENELAANNVEMLMPTKASPIEMSTGLNTPKGTLKRESVSQSLTSMKSNLAKNANTKAKSIRDFEESNKSSREKFKSETNNQIRRQSIKMRGEEPLTAISPNSESVNNTTPESIAETGRLAGIDTSNINSNDTSKLDNAANAVREDLLFSSSFLVNSIGNIESGFNFLANLDLDASINFNPIDNMYGMLPDSLLPETSADGLSFLHELCMFFLTLEKLLNDLIILLSRNYDRATIEEIIQNMIDNIKCRINSFLNGVIDGFLAAYASVEAFLKMLASALSLDLNTNLGLNFSLPKECNFSTYNASNSLLQACLVCS